MFCTKCGKQIDYDAIVCNECKAAEAEGTPEAVEVEAVEATAEVTETVEATAEVTETVEATAEVVEAAEVAETVEADAAAVEDAAVETAPAAEVANEPVVTAPVNAPAATPEDPTNKMYGFGKALTATILGVIGFFFSIFAFAFSLTGMGVIIAFVLFYPGAIAMSVIALVFGIKSIKSFASRSKQNCAKPVATLVLGIVGLAWAATSLIYILLGLFSACTIASLISDPYGSSYYF